VPLATVADRVGDFPKDQPVYVVCRSGNRSLVAARTLVEAGFTDVRNVEGGMIAWAAAGFPVQR
jgi:rhodanese-related sulfurtransferase